MSDWTIYHNPRCRKSRETLELLRSKGIEPRVVEYLREPPSLPVLEKLLMKLNRPAEEVLRKGERLFKEEYKGLKLNEHEWVRVISENPILLERPIVVKGNKAVIGRPPENVEELFKERT